MWERDRINQANNHSAQNQDGGANMARLFNIVLILGLISAAILDFPRNISELIKIGFGLSWRIIAFAILLSLFRIFNYLAFPFYVYYLLDYLLNKITDDVQLMASFRRLLFELRK